MEERNHPKMLRKGGQGAGRETRGTCVWTPGDKDWGRGEWPVDFFFLTRCHWLRIFSGNEAHLEWMEEKMRVGQ